MKYYYKTILEILQNTYDNMEIERDNVYRYHHSLGYKHGFYMCLRILKQLIYTLENPKKEE